MRLIETLTSTDIYELFASQGELSIQSPLFFGIGGRGRREYITLHMARTYYSHRSGNKIVSPMFEFYMDTLSIDQNTTRDAKLISLGETIGDKFGDKWDKIYEAIISEYTPADNLSYKESMGGKDVDTTTYDALKDVKSLSNNATQTFNNVKDEHGGNITKETDTTDTLTKSGTESSVLTKTGSEHSELTKSGTEKDTVSKGITETVTTEKTINKTDTETEDVYAFNSATESPSNKIVRGEVADGQENFDKTVTEYDNGNDSTEKSFTNRKDVTDTTYQNRQDSNNLSFNNRKDDRVVAADSTETFNEHHTKTGSIANSNSGTEMNTRDGSITVDKTKGSTKDVTGRDKSAQELLQAEIDFRVRNVLWDIIFKDIDSMICLQIY